MIADYTRTSSMELHGASVQIVVDEERASEDGGISWSQLGVRLVSPEQTLFSHVSGSLLPGEMLAIMGPSGAAKTSFLNALAAHVTGSIGTREGNRSSGSNSNNNNNNCNRNADGGSKIHDGFVRVRGMRPTKGCKRLLAYVRQTDVFLPDLTVYQTLWYAGGLRLPAQWSDDMRRERIDAVLHELGLGGCRDTPAAIGLSGGEKRRVSVALELLADPPFLFCDEPTSGLDSVTSLRLIRSFRNLADDQKKGVACTIHQPSQEMFSLFDKVLLLAQGRTVYYGRPDGVGAHFSRMGRELELGVNPAEFALHAVSRGDGQSEDAYRSSIKGMAASFQQDDDSDRGDSSAVDTPGRVLRVPGANRSWYHEVRVLTARSMQQERRTVLSATNLFQFAWVAIVCCIVWFRRPATMDAVPDRISALFFIVGFWTVTSIFTALGSFPGERAVIQRERFTGCYRLSAYVAAKTLSCIPFQFCFPTLFIVLYYWVVGFAPDASAFFAFWAVLLLNCVCAYSFGWMIACAMTNMTHSMVLGNCLCLTQLVLEGYYVKLSHIPVWFRWVCYCVFQRYTFSTLAQTEFRAWGEMDGVPAADILSSYDLDTLPSWLNMLVVIAMTVAFRIAAYVALRVTLRAEN